MQQTVASDETNSASGEQGRLQMKVPTLDRVFRLFLPDDALVHLRNARRESLLAMRAMIDARLQELDTADQAGGSARRGDIAVE
jgi:hypothetical protein